MSKTIVFKPKLESFLKKNKVKTAFIKNMKLSVKRYNPNVSSKIIGNKIKHRIDVINKLHCPIDFAFSWKYTVEGYDFWMNLNKKYITFLRKD